jgi:purine-nucleoside phosphorylase
MSTPKRPVSSITPQSFPSLQYTQEHKAVGLANPALGLHSRERIEACAQAVRARFAQPVDAAVILGTGLGALAQQMDVQVVIDYKDLPNFPLSTVETHQGRLLCGTLAGKTVVAMQGRFHRYEGYSMQQVTFPVRVLRALGASLLVVSNACGGMHPLWSSGDLMLIADHINLLGDNPLIGPNDDTLGPRFPDMSAPYDAELRAMARAVALAEGITMREGVYAAVQGPNLETRAEYRFLRLIGADVVGMSTVPEVIVARHGGMRVLGLSIITDQCLPDALAPANIDDIIKVARTSEPKLAAVVRGVLERL